MSRSAARRTSRRRRGSRGAVTAETALMLPLLLAVTAGLLWLLAVGMAQVRAVDAAREAARALARGDEPAAALALAERIAPVGSRLAVEDDAGTVVVRVEAAVAGPEGVVGRLLPDVQVGATAYAHREQP